MDEKNILYFKEMLTGQLKELLKVGDDTVSLMQNSDDRLTDTADQASFEADRNFMLRIRDREYKLINKIRKALERIEDGEFGICKTCGEDISVERLKVRPVTNQCIKCKTRHESRERIFGI